MQTVTLEKLDRVVGNAEKRCTRCQEVKSVDEFYSTTRNRDGKHIWCKDCKREVNKEYDWSESYQRRKKQHSEYSKNCNKKYRNTFQAAAKRHHEQNRKIAREARDKPCAICGRKFQWYVMDFDHISSEKMASISDLICSASPDRLIEEIAKCQVVCVICHRIKSYNESDGLVQDASYRTRRARRFISFLRGIKESQRCFDCAESFPPCAMDFDHVRGEKQFNIGNATTRSRSAVLKEIEKCDLVCAKCHRIRTFVRRTGLKE